jgi:hypothetical protein
MGRGEANPQSETSFFSRFPDPGMLACWRVGLARGGGSSRPENLVSATSFECLLKEVDAMYSIFPVEPLLLLRAIAALILAAAKLLDGMRERMPLTHVGRKDTGEEGLHK